MSSSVRDLLTAHSSRIVRLLLLGLASVVTTGAAEEPSATVELVLAVETPGGRAPSNLRPTDLEILEDGQEVRVLSVEPLDDSASAPWRHLIYFDTALLTRRSHFRAAQALADRAAELTASGTVEIVVSAPRPEVRLGRTRDPKLVRSVLQEIALSATGPEDLVSLRTAFFADRGDPTSWWEDADLDLRRDQVLASVSRETTLVEERLLVLQSWLARRLDEPAPSALWWIADGFDLDPTAFYLQGLAEEGVRSAFEQDLGTFELESAVEQLSRTLVDGGWTALPVSFCAWPTASGLRVDAVLAEPRHVLERVASDTGGLVLTHSEVLPAGTESLRRRFRVTYDGGVEGKGWHRIEVRPRRSAWTVRAPRWHRQGSRSFDDVRRALAVHDGEPPPDGLDAKCSLEGPPAEEAPRLGFFRASLRCRVGITRSMARGSGGLISFTLTTSVLGDDGVATFYHRSSFTAPRPRTAAQWRPTVALEIELPAGTRAIGVVLSEMKTGLWTSRTLEVPETLAKPLLAAAPADDEIHLEWLPPVQSSKPVYLSPLDSETVKGRVRIQAQATRPDVRSVTFWIDDKKVGTERKAPYEIWASFPDVPERKTLRVVAHDAAGTELGEDSLIVNRSVSQLRVTIREPRAIRGPGRFDVDVRVETPPRRKLREVAVELNGERLASFEHPPYRYRLLVEEPNPQGFLRAVATLDDGTQAEDVVTLGKEGFQSRVDVDLVELYTVVHDRFGKLVSHLTREDFEIAEDGIPQAVQRFEYPVTTPLTLGLVIDVSGSLRDEMPLVRHAAQNFVGQVLGADDRGFLVAFDNKPHLVQPMTGDLERLRYLIGVLPFGGGTAVFDATVYALLQLRPEAGRKALVILTDGDDTSSRHTFSQAFEFARKSDVVVYVIGLGSIHEAFISPERRHMAHLAQSTGGRIHLVESAGQLPEIYASIAEELHSQYFLAYESSQSKEKSGWRQVRLRVLSKGLKARTIHGYFVPESE